MVMLSTYISKQHILVFLFAARMLQAGAMGQTTQIVSKSLIKMNFKNILL